MRESFDIFKDSNYNLANNDNDNDCFSLYNFTTNFSLDYTKHSSHVSLFNLNIQQLSDKEDNICKIPENSLEPIYTLKQEKNDENEKNKYKNIFGLKKENLEKNILKKRVYIYRKDAYYKHFKSIFARYIKDKANALKNFCFPQFNKNNFASLSYKYTGNPKEKDNFKFLSFKIKDLLILGRDSKIKNRQYNNELLIEYIEKNESKAKHKNIYKSLINFINDSVENILNNFYEDKIEVNKLTNDPICLLCDKHFKNETGISLLEKNGFMKILRKKISII